MNSLKEDLEKIKLQKDKENTKLNCEKLKKELNIVKDRCSELEEIISKQGQATNALRVLVFLLTGVVTYLYTFK